MQPHSTGGSLNARTRHRAFINLELNGVTSQHKEQQPRLSTPLPHCENTHFPHSTKPPCAGTQLAWGSHGRRASPPIASSRMSQPHPAWGHLYLKALDLPNYPAAALGANEQTGSGGQQGWLSPEGFPCCAQPSQARGLDRHARAQQRWREGSELLRTCTATHYCYCCDIIHFPTSHLQLFTRFIPTCFSAGRWKLNAGIYPGATQPFPSSSPLHRARSPCARGSQCSQSGSELAEHVHSHSLLLLLWFWFTPINRGSGLPP